MAVRWRNTMWYLLSLIPVICNAYSPLTYEHDPSLWTTTMTPYINGTDTKIPGLDYTPDYRVEEPLFLAYKESFYKEENRPYRISPFYKQASKWSSSHKFFIELSNPDNPYLLGCYCTTVYKRLTPLAGCGIITTRHVLTTATSTDLVLRGRKHYHTLENILGVWYDTDVNGYNSSWYATPARIHYHPLYNRPENVNRSHPLPCLFDLAVWAATFRFSGTFWFGPRAYICQRGGSSWWQYTSPTPIDSEVLIVVGFQFIWSYKRIPMPWFKYAVRTRNWIIPCPKTEWGWFTCVTGRWAPLGVDSGAAMHRSFQGKTWMSDGFAGINAFSMKLRSKEMVHYFTVLDRYIVLDFLYAAYMGRLPYEYLDWRFYDSQWMAPVPKPWFYIPWVYQDPEENSYDLIFNR